MRWVHDAENYFCMGAGRLLNREKAEATSNAEVTGCPAKLSLYSQLPSQRWPMYNVLVHCTCTSCTATSLRC
jgi:hypothetical protein